ncbi:MAG: cytochrome C assembly family protein [Gammaproteobacteria bacterium]
MVNTLLSASGSLAVLLHLAASGLLLRRMSRTMSGSDPSRSPALVAAALAVLLHGLFAYSRLFTPAGLDMSFFNALSLAGWLVSTLLLALALRQPVENLGIAVFPIAAAALVLQLVIPGTDVRLIAVGSPIQAHIVLSVMAYGTLSIAALQSILLAIQDRHLHAHRPGGFVRALPPLRTMESMLFQMIAMGFALLSLALLSGVLFLEDIFAQHLVHKTVLSIAAWGVFAILLWGRWQSGWRGRTAIRWTLGGFGALLLAYFGSKFVLELILGR